MSFYGTAKKAQAPGSPSTSIGSSAETQGDGLVSWNFGDGTTTTLPNQTRFTHTFPRPGVYRVEASVTDNLGSTYRWVQMVKINAPLAAAVDQRHGTALLTVRPMGGRHGNVLAARWTFSDGSSAAGTSVAAPAGATGATVTIVDGAGDTASTTVSLG